MTNSMLRNKIQIPKHYKDKSVVKKIRKMVSWQLSWVPKLRFVQPASFRHSCKFTQRLRFGALQDELAPCRVLKQRERGREEPDTPKFRSPSVNELKQQVEREYSKAVCSACVLGLSRMQGRGLQ